MAKKGDKSGNTIIIRREEVVEGGHHGGAWKVAYADFVTAMMAFFLLMWLLNATTEDQRKGLADYFAPVNAMAHQTSGSGAPFGGRTPFDTGSLVSDRGAQTLKPGKATAMVAPDDADSETSDQMTAPRMIEDEGAPSTAQLSPEGRTRDTLASPSDGQDAAALAGEHVARNAKADKGSREFREQAEKEQQDRADAEARERVEFQHAAEQIRDAVRADPALASIAKQLAIDITPEGLRIQILDEDKQPMFPLGSVTLTERARQLLQKIGPVLAKLSEPISVTGHTDAAPYRSGERTNWELSSDRANATRRLLVESGLLESRFRGVTGAADRDPLLPGDPLAAANRRIAIVVLRTAKAAAPPAAPPAVPAAPPARPSPAPSPGAGTPAAVAPRAPAAAVAAPAIRPLVAPFAVNPAPVAAAPPAGAVPPATR